MGNGHTLSPFCAFKPINVYHLSFAFPILQEGFETATKAAAAGGFTTIVDMPL